MPSHLLGNCPVQQIVLQFELLNGTEAVGNAFGYSTFKAVVLQMQAAQSREAAHGIWQRPADSILSQVELF
jgi:hypothetical protein